MQQHLNNNDMINYGSFYTPSNLVDLTYSLLHKHINNFGKYKILDNSCGYGEFLQHQAVKDCIKIGSDIDSVALSIAKDKIHNVTFIEHNSLLIDNRLAYGIGDYDKLIIVGNPPYNDTTSLINGCVKKDVAIQMLPTLLSRDLGISFLRAYAMLNPDYICILHPLSYLIKNANFKLLKEFTNKYKLIDGIIVSSEEFTGTSKSKTYFPILIALYQKSSNDMDYQYIKNFQFMTKQQNYFSITERESVSNYITKYPNHYMLNKINPVARFWTMRDINALKRSKTFIDEITNNTIFIEQQKLTYYCYVDVFKQYIKHIPYYFGNCDVFIDNEYFLDIQDSFLTESAMNNNHLRKFIPQHIDYDCNTIKKYFKTLLGKHYVN